jgi:hypothetical protein
MATNKPGCVHCQKFFKFVIYCKINRTLSSPVCCFYKIQYLGFLKLLKYLVKSQNKFLQCLPECGWHKEQVCEVSTLSLDYVQCIFRLKAEFKYGNP